MKTFKSFVTESNLNQKILGYLKDLFKNDHEFIEMLKQANNDEAITKIVEYITSKYSVELNKLMKQYKLTPMDLAKYILALKKE